MQRTKRQIETSIARLRARYARLDVQLRALRQERSAIDLKQAAILKSIVRLDKSLTTAREDVEKRSIVETTVAEKTGRRLLTASLVHPDGKTHRNGQYWFRCGKEVLARYAVGDTIETSSVIRSRSEGRESGITRPS
jgi:hypothetical protein